MAVHRFMNMLPNPNGTNAIASDEEVDKIRIRPRVFR